MHKLVQMTTQSLRQESCHRTWFKFKHMKKSMHAAQQTIAQINTVAPASVNGTIRTCLKSHLNPSICWSDSQCASFAVLHSNVRSVLEVPERSARYVLGTHAEPYSEAKQPLS